MMSLNKNEPFGGQSRNIFRLAAVLCLFFTINPAQYIDLQRSPADSHGIGGGYIMEDVLTEAEMGIMLTPASMESVMESVLETDNLLKNRILLYNSHTIQRGENISSLAISFGLNQDTIISANKISNTRLLQVGRALRIPNQDGIFHTVRSGETLEAIAERYKADMEAIQTANELFSDNVIVGTDLFIPGARLSWERLQEINGDLFLWPVSGTITSGYGWRRNPFNRSVRQFHNGIDIRGSVGTPVRAAMAGRVSTVGFDRVLGNYVIVNHNAGYRTLYGHLSVIRTRTGAYVAAGERIGDVGNTGQSTGSHLHFTVYRNGATVNPRALMR
ncbi:MAG: M23 family metallopeptidase [Treponema sp.]|nr:M23 family metallopeptidase [Treponema sp.]